MKKQLLLGSALLAAISAFPQDGRTQAQPTKMVRLASKVALKYQGIRNTQAVEATPFQAPSQPVNARTASTNSLTPINPNNLTTVWNGFTGSENTYGVLVNTSKSLQYNDELGRVSFVHRKSHTYQASPLPAVTASTGVIVAEISNSWGQDWDSTCVWNDNTYWARYPAGGIYNPSGNQDARNAYVIGTGPITGAASQWLGNYFGSKQLDTVHGARFTGTLATTAGTLNGSTIGRMDFISNSAPFGNVGKVDFARLDFSATSDGKVRVLGNIANNVNDATSNAGYGLRGCRIVKATFNQNTNGFDWASEDTLSFITFTGTPVAYENTAESYYVVRDDPHMNWSDDGSVGYVWQIGSRAGATGNNVGLQPIIFKTTDHGASWTGPYGLDFNSAAASTSVVINHLEPVSLTPSLTIPWFNANEDADGIVDVNYKLHIMTTVTQHAKAHQDSLLYFYPFVNSVDNETYTFEHIPGRRPYIYDFVGDCTGPWQTIVVDSMSSEGPGWALSTDAGFDYNPWDIDPTSNQKIAITSRMQMSRTPDSKYIIYTWSESDTTTTTGQVKWNISPNVKARMLNATTMTMHPNKINITDPLPPLIPFTAIRGFAYNHYISPKCAYSTNWTPGNVAVILPMTVSNNQALLQAQPVTHYYSSVVLNFDNLATIIAPPAPDYKVGIAENTLNSVKASIIYPNPAKGNATLSIDLKDNAKLTVSVMNLVGQQVKSTEASAQMGQNNINIDLNGLSKGIYMVNIKAGNAMSTKKLVVE